MGIDFKLEEMKILLVDDVVENIKILISTLQPVGYQLAFVNSGEDALNVIKNFKPDLILMDIIMPGINGLETCERLKADASTRNIPVIFTTAKTDLEDIVQGFKVGGVDYVTKPYNSDELCVRVQTQLMLRSAMSKLETTNVELVEHQDHLEELVKQRTSSLEASNTVLESYSYSLAHDLKTPLRGIISLSQILVEETADKLESDEKELLHRIVKAGLHMSKLLEGTQQLFSVTRDKIIIEPVNLTQISQSVINKLQAENPDRGVLVDIAPEIIVKGDSNSLQTVMEHLIGNAWKFTIHNPETNINVGCYQEAEQNVCYVRDNGIGFDMQYAQKLFNSFTRIHSLDEYAGLGIGLVMVQQIIDRLGGKAWAEGKINEGATFYFSLPG